MTCGTCRHFDNSPQAFERAFPGLASFGSASASVRDEDGICRLHERHLSKRSGCGHHVAVTDGSIEPATGASPVRKRIISPAGRP